MRNQLELSRPRSVKNSVSLSIWTIMEVMVRFLKLYWFFFFFLLMTRPANHTKHINIDDAMVFQLRFLSNVSKFFLLGLWSCEECAPCWYSKLVGLTLLAAVCSTILRRRLLALKAFRLLMCLAKIIQTAYKMNWNLDTLLWSEKKKGIIHRRAHIISVHKSTI